MKQSAVLYLLAWTLLAPLPAFAQEKPNEVTHNELRAMRDGFSDAINKGDIDRQLAYLHPNVVVTWHNAEISRGRDAVRAYYDRMMSGPKKIVEKYTADLTVDELTILYGGDIGVSFGSAVEHFHLSGGKSFDLNARWSATLVKENGEWLIANLHASNNLFDNPILTMTRKTSYWIGVICGVVGLVVGWLIGRAGKRAPSTPTTPSA